MKKSILLLVTLVFAFGTTKGQDVTTVQLVDEDFSNQLDLEAVASLFGEAENLEHFEQLINDPQAPVSNLDLNNDRYIDYLRVVEDVERNVHYITIQAVLGNRLYQDVATIDVVRDDRGVSRIQVVGNVHMYGPDFIIEPVFVVRPRIFASLWVSFYRPYVSRYRWGFYPAYYRPCRPVATRVYINTVVVHKQPRVRYYHVARRRVRPSTMVVSHHRNDYYRAHPKRSRSTNSRVANASRNNNNRSVSRRSTSVNRGAGTTTRRSSVTTTRSTNNNRSVQPRTSNRNVTAKRSTNSRPSSSTSTRSRSTNSKVAAKPKSVQRPNSSVSSKSKATPSRTRTTTSRTVAAKPKSTSRQSTSRSASKPKMSKKDTRVSKQVRSKRSVVAKRQ